MSLKELAAEAAKLIAEQELTGDPGAVKRRRVIATLSRKLDDSLEFGDGIVGRLAELFDGPAIKLALTLLVEGVLAGMRAARRATSPE
ncbi:MAG: hypothetical protein L0221_15810 [Chloroflexi bacterium]|nr:hypothetical protein [Chloroflexota bacterium]